MSYAVRRPLAVAVRLALSAALAAAVTVALFVTGRHQTPDYTAQLFGQSGVSAIRLKSWMATGVLGLAVVQLGLALWMYGRLPGLRQAPRGVPRAHRIGGVILFAVTVPVAVQCMRAYGVQTASTRVMVHSIAGCFFYGAFAAKVLLVRSRRLPGWVLPLAGGTVITVIAVFWYVSALWYFNGNLP
ncbi:DUF6529 family protein [Streptomyces sp. H10-C2]|uniref:DUF6529 family protein n=1 Tax=unclassified Streptomyces TaxID=2593676 RepID=UPI0024BB0E52|nr:MULTISPECIES: DUF6529 family protein [unclassified Streptomyces]MDJ0346136.1 DUF6529 family protein [Streptomyces sp. PH10-H1]MDJ0371602.1 DUF6529 family protein [Streptomyces sp. H10-C2]